MATQPQAGRFVPEAPQTDKDPMTPKQARPSQDTPAPDSKVGPKVVPGSGGGFDDSEAGVLLRMVGNDLGDAVQAYSRSVHGLTGSVYTLQSALTEALALADRLVTRYETLRGAEADAPWRGKAAKAREGA